MTTRTDRGPDHDPRRRLRACASRPASRPVQAVIVPISIGNWKETVLPAAQAAAASLKKAGLRVEHRRPRGVHARLEIRRVRDAGRPAADRDRPARRQGRPGRPRPPRHCGPRSRRRSTAFAGRVAALLEEIQAELFRRGPRLPRGEHPGRGRPTTSSRTSSRTSAASSGPSGAATRPARTGSRTRRWPRSGSSRSSDEHGETDGPLRFLRRGRQARWPVSPVPIDSPGRGAAPRLGRRREFDGPDRRTSG